MKTEKATGQKVPIIRLKLKVKEQMKSVEAEGDNRECEPLEESAQSTMSDPTAQSPMINHNSTQSPRAHSAHSAHSLSTPTNNSTHTTHVFHGTYRYRPFKLFPLLPSGSRYRVLIPAKYTTPSNPALKLNYIWQRHEESELYTDDSDLVCLLARRDDFDWLKGRNILVEVEVSDKEDVTLHDDAVNKHNEHNDQSARKCTGHDGNYMRIIKYTEVTESSSIHFKGWKKRCNTKKNLLIYTPKFRPGGTALNGHNEQHDGRGEEQFETGQGSTKETKTKG